MLSFASLRARILWSVALLAFLAVGLLALTSREFQRLASEESARFASEAEALVRQSLLDAEREAETLTLLAVRTQAVRDAGERCPGALQELLPLGSRFENLLRFDEEGRILCTALPFPADEIQEGPRTRAALDRIRDGSGAFFMTGAFVDGAGHSILVFTRGLKDAPGGIMVGVVLDMEEAPLFPGWPQAMALVLTDAEGRVGLRLPRDLPSPSSGPVSPRAADPADLAAAWGISRLESARWLGMEGMPADWFLTVGLREGYRPTPPAAGVAVRNIAVGGGLLLVGVAIVLFGLRSAVLPPMTALARASGLLAAGKLSVRVPPEKMPTELQPVSRAFNRMAEALESSHQASAASREAMAESEARYRNLFEKSPHAMWVYDPESLRILDVNAAMEALYGFDRATLLSMTPLDLRAEAEHDRFLAGLAEVRAGAATEPQLWTHRHRDGGNLHVEIRARTIHLNGRAARLALALDVTARVQAEAARVEAETRLREILANSRDCVWMQDASTRELLFVSPGYALIWGRDPADLMAGRDSFLATLHPEDRDRSREARRARPNGGHEEVYRILRPDGEIRWVLDRSFAIRDDEGKVYRIAGVASDITERKRLEDQLVVSQRLEAVGQLAGGLAHDFNNLLTVIRGHLELARLDLEPSTPASEELEEAGVACRRAGDLVQQLLAFSRRQILLPQVVELGTVLGGAERLLRRALPDTVEFVTDGLDTPAPVGVDTGKVEQALLNLALNARDAMPMGGTLRISLVREEVTSAQAVDGPVAPGTYGVLEIADTGCGMDPLTAARAFDPFYTTKEMGKGSGLGLSMVHGIVDQSGGYVQLRTAPGAGTTIRLLFPVFLPDPEPAPGSGGEGEEAVTAALVEPAR